MCHFVGIWLAGKLIAATGDGIFSNIRLWNFGSLIERTNRIWNILIFYMEFNSRTNTQGKGQEH